MKRITLLQRLRPEIKQSLDASTTEYEFAVKSIYEELEEAVMYQDLTMSTIYSIYLFGNLDMYEAEIFDIRWGDNLFTEHPRETTVQLENELRVETL